MPARQRKRLQVAARLICGIGVVAIVVVEVPVNAV